MSASPLPRDTVIGVAGAGTMGRGIAMVAAAAGHPVLLYDAQEGAAAAALARLRADTDTLVARGKISAETANARLGRLTVATDLAPFAAAGLVVEAITETIEAKVALFRAVEAIAGEAVILATNTSSLSVTALAARLRRPAALVGMHFFNPAPVLPLVEIVVSPLTSAAVADCVEATARQWGKTPVRCRSTPGFIVNRVARPYYAEALRLLAERAAEPATLDAVMRESGGFRMGPFELMDLIGHDVNFAVTRTVYEATFHDPRYRPSLVQRELVEAGLLGRKSGRGFYDHAPGAPTPAALAAPPAPAPRRLVVEGDLGPATALLALTQARGLPIETRPGEGCIRLDGAVLALTDGRTATARAAACGQPVVLFDLTLDYAEASRIAIAGADQAGPAAVVAACGFFQALGKRVSVLDDAPGLVVMRSVAMLANEAAEAVQQGIATAEDVDLAMLKGVNYPRGPFAWGTVIGWRRIVAVLDNLAAAYGEDHYRAAPLARRKALA